MLALAGLAVFATMRLAAVEPDWQAAIKHAARANPDARIVVLDVATNQLLGANHLAETARTLAAPGSTLKPLILYQLLAESRWNADHRIACDRNLMIAGHRLACSHPLMPPYNASEALTWSCNTYFAQVARTILPGQLGPMLRATGLLGVTGIEAKNGVEEASAAYREPASPEAVELEMLGVEGIRVTPLELGAAYRWLALELAAHSSSTAAKQVRQGLADSASFGIASAASLTGASIAGKTGTAEGGTTVQTHGWFAGLSPADNARVVIIVYLPTGHGADAARVAAEVLAQARGAQH